MKRSGFTLIETLFALAIAVSVLVVTVQGNRAILRNSTLTEQSAQMTGLIDDSENNLRNLQKTLLSRTPPVPLGDLTLGLRLPSGLANVSTEMVFYSPPVADHRSATVIRFCALTSVNGCLSQVSPIQTASGSRTILNLLSDSDTDGELIAVRKVRTDRRRVLSMTERYTADVVVPCVNNPSPNGAPPCLTTTSNSDKNNWDFYTRKIVVTRVGTASSTYFDYGQNLVTAGAKNTARGNTYVVTITVKRYGDLETPKAERTIILTDWK